MAPGDLLCLEKCLEKSPDRTRDSRRASLYRYHSLFLKRERYLEASYFLAWFLFHARCLFIVCERLRIPIPGCHVFHDALPIQRETLRFLPGPLFLYHVHFTHTHTDIHTHTPEIIMLSYRCSAAQWFIFYVSLLIPANLPLYKIFVSFIFERTKY